jgi:hypothetical protein
MTGSLKLFLVILLLCIKQVLSDPVTGTDHRNAKQQSINVLKRGRS